MAPALTTRVRNVCLCVAFALAGRLLCSGQMTAAASGPAPAASVAPAAASPAVPSVAPAAAGVFPLADVHRGLTGVAYTVFEGVTPEPMGVQILGVLKDAIGPGQDMILARLTGEKAQYTGVVAGMSGSPVYVDGRLVGALSYRIGVFSKEPICGITPIEQMFEVRDRQEDSNIRVASAADLPSRFTAALAPDHPPQPASGSGEVQPIETALVFGGFSQKAIDLFGDRFRAMGMTPVAGLGGAAPAGTRQPEPIVPGSAVSAVLVRGDLSISGTCTVTYVDSSQLLACGHPITQFGPVAIPMTKAEVVTTLASPLNAFKIINTTETVGEFTEDRASAILGRFGQTARMIPVSVQVLPPASSAPTSGPLLQRISQAVPGKAPAGIAPPLLDAAPHGMQFEVLDNRALTPQAMLVSVYQSLSGTNASANEISYRMTGELSLAGQPPVRMEGIMAPSELGSGATAAALYVNDRFSRLYDNSLQQPEVSGLHLTMQQIPGRRTAALMGARLDQTEVRPGQEVTVEATIHPYQSDAQVLRVAVKLPDTLTPGPMRVVVSDGATLDRLLDGGTAVPSAATHAVSLADSVAQMNRTHPNDRLYVTLLERAPQAALEGASLPEVPLSMVNVLEPLKTSQKAQFNSESAVPLGSADTGFALSGSQAITLTVR